MNRRTPDRTQTLAPRDPVQGVQSPASGPFPSSRELLDPRGSFLVPLVLLVITRFGVAMQIPAGTEDAYITYRYAQHKAMGGGLTYNPGERVMGFSSPLWTLWNAIGYALVHQPLLWSRVTALAADAITLLTMGTLLSGHASTTSARCFTDFFAVWSYFPAVGMSGLETSLLLALIPLSAALVAARSPAGGVSLAALALTRPEGVAAALALAIGARWRERIVALVVAVAGSRTRRSSAAWPNTCARRRSRATRRCSSPSG